MAGENLGSKFTIDITELKAGLAQANRLIRESESEFKAAAAGMDDWSTSQEGLEAKLKSLNTTSDLQREKVNALKKQYDELVKNGMNPASREAVELRTKINNETAALNKSEKAIADTENALRELNSESGEAADSVQDVADSAEDAGEGFTVFKGAIAGFIANGLTALVDGLKSAISYLGTFGDEADRAFNSFAASTGTAAEDMGEFEQAIKNIYNNNFGESLEDIAGSMALIKQQSGDIGADELERMTTNALMLRDTFDFDVSESIRAVNSLMNQTGISADEAFNLIAQGAQKGLNQNGDLLDVINEYSGQFFNAGYNAEDMFNMLANGAEEGTWSVDKLGDAIKEYNIRASDGTVAETLADNAEALGLNEEALKTITGQLSEGLPEANEAVLEALRGVEDYNTRYQLGVSLFGTMWEDLGESAIYALMSTQGEISKTSDALESINAVKYNSVGEAISGIKRNLETGILLPISENVLPKLNELANSFSAWLNDPATKAAIDDLAAKLSDFAMNAIDAVITAAKWFIDNKDIILAGISGIAAGFAAWNVVSIVNGAITAVKNFKNVIAALNVVMKANVIGIVVTAIAALVAAFIYAWNNIDGFKEFWINLWETVKTACLSAWDAISAFFTETVPAFWESIKQWFSDGWNSIVSFFTEGIPKFFEQIKKWFSDLPYKLGYLVGQLLGRVIQFYADLWKFATQDIPKFINKIIEFFKKLPGNVWTWLKNTITKIGEFAVNIAKQAQTAGTNFVNNVVSFVKNLPGNVWTWLQNTITKAGTFAKNLAQKGTEAARDLFDNIVNKIKDLPGEMLDLGSDIVKGLWNGINDMAGWIGKKIKSFGDGVLSGIKDFFGIESPSKLMRDEVGTMIAAGIGEGVEEGADEVNRTINNAMDIGGNSTGGVPTFGGTNGGRGSVVVNQNNYFSQAHSRAEIYRAKKQTVAAVRSVLAT